MAVRRIGILGCGLMGSGIAQVAAQAGYDVTVRELTVELYERGLKRIRQSLDKFVEKDKLSAADRDAARD